MPSSFLLSAAIQYPILCEEYRKFCHNYRNCNCRNQRLRTGTIPTFISTGSQA